MCFFPLYMLLNLRQKHMQAEMKEKASPKLLDKSRKPAYHGRLQGGGGGALNTIGFLSLDWIDPKRDSSQYNGVISVHFNQMESDTMATGGFHLRWELIPTISFNQQSSHNAEERLGLRVCLGNRGLSGVRPLLRPSVHCVAFIALLFTQTQRGFLVASSGSFDLLPPVQWCWV